MRYTIAKVLYTITFHLFGRFTITSRVWRWVQMPCLTVQTTLNNVIFKMTGLTHIRALMEEQVRRVEKAG